MSVQYIKNDKFHLHDGIACKTKGILQYNPYAILDRVFYSFGLWYNDYLYPTEDRTHFCGSITADLTGISFSSGDPIMIGGQAVGYWIESAVGDQSCTIAIPFGMYEPEVYLPDIYQPIGDMIKSYDTMYVFKRYFNTAEYNAAFWHIDDGGTVIPRLTNSDTAWDDPNIIKNVDIINYSIIRNQSVFGHNSKVYATNNKYKVTLSLPASTPIEKVDQLLQSPAVMFQVDDRSTYNMNNDYNWSFDTPLGGGTISALAKKVSLLTETLKMVTGSKRYEIEGIIEG